MRNRIKHSENLDKNKVNIFRRIRKHKFRHRRHPKIKTRTENTLLPTYRNRGLRPGNAIGLVYLCVSGFLYFLTADPHDFRTRVPDRRYASPIKNLRLKLKSDDQISLVILQVIIIPHVNLKRIFYSLNKIN